MTSASTSPSVGAPVPHRLSSVSAMFPCYNDAATIGGLVDDVHTALAPLADDLEVIVVNDGSADGSREVLDGLATTRPWLRVVHHERNRGYGGALLSGFAAARNEWIFYTDGDAQYDASEAAALVPLATDDVDIVQIAELMAVEGLQLTAEHEVQQLARALGLGRRFGHGAPGLDCG